MVCAYVADSLACAGQMDRPVFSRVLIFRVAALFAAVSFVFVLFDYL
jgi:hypothetical protein